MIQKSDTLPSALEAFPAERMKNSSPVIFLDYDGTLTPIVSHPQEAYLSDTMRRFIQSLAGHYPVAIISGRALQDVKQRVALDELYYSGSHGFEISEPGGQAKAIGEVQKLTPVIASLEKELKSGLSPFPGVYMELKPYSLAVHYRNVSTEKKGEVIASTHTICKAYPQVRLHKGKEVINIDPAMDWDKGKAVLRLLECMPVKEPSLPLYLGDDITDEDAFKALKNRGIGILIKEENRNTYADYTLNNIDEVAQFLQKLIA